MDEAVVDQASQPVGRALDGVGQVGAERALGIERQRFGDYVVLWELPFLL